MITDVTCPQFSTAILQRARLKSEGIKLALGKNQSLGLWANRRQSGSNPAHISKDPGCCGGQDRQECPCTISVRGARCCGSGPGGCGLAMLAGAFPARRCTAGARGARWDPLARRCPGLARRCVNITAGLPVTRPRSTWASKQGFQFATIGLLGS